MTLISAVVTRGEIDVAVPDSLLQTASTAPALEVAEPITLQRAKEHLRVVDPDEDDYISSLIVAARQMAESRLNRTLVQRQRVARFGTWDDPLVLLKPPVISVDSIDYVDGAGDETLLDPTQFYLPPFNEDELPRVEMYYPLPALAPRRAPITVTYTTGYPAGQVPAPIVQWMLLSIGTMYENRATEVVGAIVAALPDDFARWLLQPFQVYE